MAKRKRSLSRKKWMSTLSPSTRRMMATHHRLTRRKKKTRFSRASTRIGRKRSASSGARRRSSSTKRKGSRTRGSAFPKRVMGVVRKNFLGDDTIIFNSSGELNSTIGTQTMAYLGGSVMMEPANLSAAFAAANEVASYDAIATGKLLMRKYWIKQTFLNLTSGTVKLDLFWCVPRRPISTATDVNNIIFNGYAANSEAVLADRPTGYVLMDSSSYTIPGMDLYRNPLFVHNFHIKKTKTLNLRPGKQRSIYRSFRGQKAWKFTDLLNMDASTGTVTPFTTWGLLKGWSFLVYRLRGQLCARDNTTGMTYAPARVGLVSELGMSFSNVAFNQNLAYQANNFATTGTLIIPTTQTVTTTVNNDPFFTPVVVS